VKHENTRTATTTTTTTSKKGDDEESSFLILIGTGNTMASLSLSLPAPRRSGPSLKAPPLAEEEAAAPTPAAQEPKAPSYEERCRAAAALSQTSPEERRKTKLFVPRSLADFDDGGAFPEIPVAQYPRHMGNPHVKKSQANSRGAQSTSTALVNVEIDKDGSISYDSIIKAGTNSDKKVYTRHEDLRGGEAKPEDVALPTEEEEAAESARTQAAFATLLAKKTKMDKPSGSALANAETSQNVEAKTQFIKYASRPDAPGYNPAAAQRVIQMVPAQMDPMNPPKHKHIKAPRGPAEDPVPVLHAPPPKLSKEEREAWNIPSSISNWKNSRGYTIPLDKRLAADGRGLRDHSINSNFATLSESLYVAERQARQEVRMRAQVQKKLVLQEKDKREEELRQLANQARLERGGVATEAPAAAAKDGAVSDEEESDLDEESIDEVPREDRATEGTEDEAAARQRERLRMERKREREKEMRLEKSMDAKKRKLEEERDVSEKVALGVHTGTGGLAGEVDSRLYNQSGGMDTGFGAEDDYNTYSKPLFARQHAAASSSLYRPSRGESEYNADEQYDELKSGATSKFAPHKGFAGAEGGMDVQAGPRTEPVQFEKSDKSDKSDSK
jgi:SNW domain-containing protein 1